MLTACMPYGPAIVPLLLRIARYIYASYACPPHACPMGLPLSRPCSTSPADLILGLGQAPLLAAARYLEVEVMKALLGLTEEGRLQGGAAQERTESGAEADEAGAVEGEARQDGPGDEDRQEGKGVGEDLEEDNGEAEAEDEEEEDEEEEDEEEHSDDMPRADPNEVPWPIPWPLFWPCPHS